jgi:hypothetical protein
MEYMNEADRETFLAETTETQRLLGARHPYVWLAMGVALAMIGLAVLISDAFSVPAAIVGFAVVCATAAYPTAVGLWSLRHPKQAKEVAWLRRKYTASAFDSHPWRTGLSIGGFLVVGIGIDIGLRSHSVETGLSAGALTAMVIAAFFGLQMARSRDRM